MSQINSLRKHRQAKKIAEHVANGSLPKDKINDLVHYGIGQDVIDYYYEHLVTAVSLIQKSKCECGGDKARTTHSTWCPKHAC